MPAVTDVPSGRSPQSVFAETRSVYRYSSEGFSGLLFIRTEFAKRDY